MPAALCAHEDSGDDFIRDKEIDKCTLNTLCRRLLCEKHLIFLGLQEIARVVTADQQAARMDKFTVNAMKKKKDISKCVNQRKTEWWPQPHTHQRPSDSEGDHVFILTVPVYDQPVDMLIDSGPLCNILMVSKFKQMEVKKWHHCWSADCRLHHCVRWNPTATWRETILDVIIGTFGSYVIQKWGMNGSVYDPNSRKTFLKMDMGIRAGNSICGANETTSQSTCNDLFQTCDCGC